MPPRHRAMQEIEMEELWQQIRELQETVNAQQALLKKRRGITSRRRNHFQRQNFKNDDIRVEVPEIEGKLQPDDFVDWMQTVERIFEYKEKGEEPLVNEEPIFDEEPVFDEKPVFDEDPVFDEEPIFDEEPVFDEEPEYDDEITCADQRESLMIRLNLHTAISKEEPWLRHNIYHTRCITQGKVCDVIIDSGSCENVVSNYIVEKLSLPTQEHPQPYKLQWLNKGSKEGEKITLAPISPEKYNKGRCKTKTRSLLSLVKKRIQRKHVRYKT